MTSTWKEIAIPSNLVGQEYGRATKIFTPKSYGDYSLFVPTKCLSSWGGMTAIRYADTFSFSLSKPVYDHFGKSTGWEKETISVEEFERIWEGIAHDVHHIPVTLEPEYCEVNPELIDE